MCRAAVDAVLEMGRAKRINFVLDYLQLILHIFHIAGIKHSRVFPHWPHLHHVDLAEDGSREREIGDEAAELMKLPEEPPAQTFEMEVEPQRRIDYDPEVLYLLHTFNWLPPNF